MSSEPADEYTGVVPGLSGLNRPMAPQPPRKPSSRVRALTDFGFTKNGVKALAPVLYVVVIVWAVLSWAASIVGGFTGVFGSGGNVVSGLGALLFGWIPALAYILIARIGLEVAVTLTDGASSPNLDDSFFLDQDMDMNEMTMSEVTSEFTAPIAAMQNQGGQIHDLGQTSTVAEETMRIETNAIPDNQV